MAAEPGEKPIVFGAAYSVYVRAVRLTLIEKGVPYDLAERFGASTPSATKSRAAGWRPTKRASLRRWRNRRFAFRALDDIRGEAPWLAGPAVTLADLHAAPMFDYFLQTAEGREMFGRFPRLAAWWPPMAARLADLLAAG
jgi:glutathione S-transferase